MEACAGAYYWAREFSKLGRCVRLIADLRQPLVKRPICEAAQRPSILFVPVKTEEQQANGIVFRARDLWRQRT
jgi:transposase